MPSSGGKTCALDRKSTRLNSSHTIISYAVFCLKKKEKRHGGRYGTTSGKPGACAARRGRVAAPAGSAERCRRPRAQGRAPQLRSFFFLSTGAPPNLPPFPRPCPFPT